MADVLVTGAFGVFGNQVLRRLVKEGIRPVGMSRNPDLSLVKDVVSSIDVARGDVTNIVDILSAIKKYKVKRIIHAANLIGAAEADPWQGFQVGAVGTANVLEAARLMDIERVVYTSSKGAYGLITGGEHAFPRYKPVTEEHIRNPEYDSIYAAAKVLGENVGWAYHDKHGVDFAALRFGHTWGPGKQARHGPLSIFSKIVENAMVGKPTKIAQGGDEKDDIVYLKDVGLGIVRACCAPSVPSMFYNIASGRLVGLNDFTAAVRKVLPKAQIEVGPGLDYINYGHQRYSLYDISRAQSELGYQPEYVDVEKGVRDYVETMKALGLEPQPS